MKADGDASETRPRPDARILVAEDNPINQKLAVAMLRKIGFAADVVSDGHDAVEAVSHTTYAAVLMDCHMPRMDGYRATAEIRRLEGDAERMPIIAMTAAVTDEDRNLAADAGMNDFIPKPVEMERLASVLDRWIRREEGTADEGPRENEPSTAEDVIDPTRLADLRRLDEGSEVDVLAELVSLFVRGSLECLPRLQRAAAESDATAVHEEAHLLRGIAANIGARRMASLCAEVEAIGKTGRVDVTATSQLVRRIEEELDRARSALQAST